MAATPAWPPRSTPRLFVDDTLAEGRELLKNLTVDLLLGDKLGAVRHLIAFLLAEVLPSELKQPLTEAQLTAAALTRRSRLCTRHGLAPF